MQTIINDNVISNHYQNIIDAEILSGSNWPWFFNKISTTEKFPFFSHALIKRSKNEEVETNDANSQAFDFFKDILDTFCLINGIRYNRILRSSLNMSLPSSKYEYTDPHVDHHIPHVVVLMYLNDCNETGNTIIFEEKYDGKTIDHPLDDVRSDLTIKQEIKPVKGRIVCFDGHNYHANRFCEEPNVRVICVFTIEV